jgi:Glycosyl hydrolase family 57
MKSLLNFPHRLKKKIQRDTRNLSHMKFAEPILVFESDDWGMERKPAANVIQKFAEPGEWADEQTESIEDMQCLFETLTKYRDPHGRPACFTANFIMANPDFDRIEKAAFQHYYDVTLDTSLSDPIRQKYLFGIHQKCFSPQYHGRKHFWTETWLKDLRENVRGSRELFDERCHGGLSLLQGEGWRYHSEYVDWKSGKTPTEENIYDSMKEDLDIFERLFGYRSLSVIPPHYIFTPDVEKVWKRLGIRYIQGAGYRLIRKSNGSTQTKSHYLGEASPQDLIYSIRTVKFDPRPSRPNQNWQAAVKLIELCFERGVPAVVDTHRINYTGKYRDEGIRQLNELLNACQKHKPLFLNSVELGDAVSRNGEYTDVFDQKNYSLRTIQNLFQPLTRKINPFIN